MSVKAVYFTSHSHLQPNTYKNVKFYNVKYNVLVLKIVFKICLIYLPQGIEVSESIFLEYHKMCVLCYYN